MSVKPDFEINMNKLKNKEYEVEELLLEEPPSLGSYKGDELLIKHGKFGYYVEWGEHKESIKSINIPVNEITRENLIEFIEHKKEVPFLRKINSNMEVRRGKFGMYVFYQTPSMKKPQFLNSKKFKEGILTAPTETIIQWINETYKLEEK